MKKSKEIVASECQNMAEGTSMMQPTKEHFDYLYHLIVSLTNETSRKFKEDVKRGDELANEFYSKQFIEATK